MPWPDLDDVGWSTHLKLLHWVQLLQVHDKKKYGDDAFMVPKDALCNLETNLVGATVTYWGDAGTLDTAVSSQEKVQMHYETGKRKNVVR